MFRWLRRLLSAHCPALGCWSVTCGLSLIVVGGGTHDVVPAEAVPAEPVPARLPHLAGHYAVLFRDTEGQTETRWFDPQQFPTLVDAIVHLGGLPPGASADLLIDRRSRPSSNTRVESKVNWDWLARSPQGPSNLALVAGDCVVVNVAQLPGASAPQVVLADADRNLEVMLRWFNRCVAEGRHEEARAIGQRIAQHYPEHPARRLCDSVLRAAQWGEPRALPGHYTVSYPVADFCDCHESLQLDPRGQTAKPWERPATDAEDSLKTIAEQLQKQMAIRLGHGEPNIVVDERRSSLVIVESEAGHRAVAETLHALRDRLATIQVQRLDLPLETLRSLRLDKPCALLDPSEKVRLLSACRDVAGGRVYRRAVRHVRLDRPFRLTLETHPDTSVQCIPSSDTATSTQLEWQQAGGQRGVIADVDGPVMIALEANRATSAPVALLLFEILPRTEASDTVTKK